MSDEQKTKAELIEELKVLRQKQEILTKQAEENAREQKLSLDQAQKLVESAKRELKEKEDQLDLVLDSSGLALSQFDITTGTSLMTETLEKILGYQPGKVLKDNGQKWRPLVDGDEAARQSLIHPEDRERYLGDLQKLIDEVEPNMDSELRGRTADGSYRWLRNFGKIGKYDDNGKPLVSYGVFLDIDKTKRLQLDLEKSKTETEQKVKELENQERRFRTLVTNIPGVVYRCDPDKHWTVRYISDYVTLLTGYPASDFIENRVRSFASIIHPEDIKKVEREVKIGIESDGFYLIEYRIIHADGSIKWVFERGAVFVDECDNVESLDGLVMDITGRKQQEQALVKSEKELQTLIHALPVAIAMFGGNGRIRLVNAAAVDLFGYTLDDIPTLEAWWPKAYPDPEYRKERISAWKQMLQKPKSERVDNFEVLITCKDGHQLLCEVQAFTVGSLTGAIFVDVGNRRKKAREIE